MSLVATLEIFNDAGDRRSGSHRSEVGQQSTLRNRDGVPCSVMVDDLSASGFRFVISRHLCEGARVRLGLAGAGAAEARVVWRSDDVHGCEFLQPLTEDQLRSSFSGSSVVECAFPVGFSDCSEPAIGRWPGPVRLAVLLLGTALAWAGLIAVVTIIS